MKLIVNVDDAGIHPAVARAVAILAEKGVVTSASLVANGIDTENASRLENVSLGVHLDILRGQPLSHWQEINSLVDENGSFLKDPVALFRRYAMGKVDHAQVEKEWSAQIEHVIDLGVQPSHLTSHKHVHSWPTLARMAGDLSKKYNIGWVRKPEECSEISRLDKTGLQPKFLNVCGLFTRETDDVNWTDVFWGLQDISSNLTPEAFMEYIKGCDCGEDDVVELCCRPGVTVAGDPPIPPHTNPLQMSTRWRDEFKSLAELNWCDAITTLGFDLTNFKDLS